MTPMQSMDVVHIIDDDADMRASLACVLNSVGYRTIGFPTADDFLTAAPTTVEQSAATHCALIDLLLPGMSGMKLCEELRNRRASCAFMVITGNGDVQSAVQAMRLGACDYLEKPFTQRQLLEAVHAGLQSAREANERMSEQDGVRSKLKKLTARELEIFRALADGMLTKEIAKHFAISTRTVDVHRSRIMQKLDISSPLQIAAFISVLGDQASKLSGPHFRPQASARAMPADVSHADS